MRQMERKAGMDAMTILAGIVVLKVILLFGSYLVFSPPNSLMAEQIA